MSRLRLALETCCLLSLMAFAFVAGLVLLPYFLVRWVREERGGKREVRRVLRGGHWNHEELA